jgi:trimethylamine--corrinoid protein Co-methyltransferase
MRLEPLPPEEIQEIHTASSQILARTGVRFASAKALGLFAAAGALVDSDQKRVRIPETLLDRALGTTTDHFRLWNRGGDKQLDLRDGQVRGHNVGGCVRIFDVQQGQARGATKHDLEQLTTLIDALENIDVCRPVVYPAEFPTMLRDIHVAATMLQHTDKPYGVSAYSLDNLSYILELTTVLAGDLENLTAKPFVWGSVCPDSPLSYSESTTEILIRYAELGLPVAIAPCPICGGTSPVTLAGSLVQLNAEFLAGLVLVQLIHPGIDVKYTARPIPMNLKTGTADFGAIEMGMMSAVIVQLAKRYRVCSDVYGLGTRSLGLDAQSAYEKALNGLLVALAGADLVAAAGLLENALTSSAEQLVIDDEILGMIFRAVRGIELTADTLAVEPIMKAGPGGSFLTDPHTLRFMRTERFQPELDHRAGSGTGQASRQGSVLDAATERVGALLKSHQPPPLPRDTVAEFQRILDHAARGLETA